MSQPMKPNKCSANVFYCPAMIEDLEGDGVWMIGKVRDVPAEVAARVAEGEAAVWVPRDVYDAGLDGAEADDEG